MCDYLAKDVIIYGTKCDRELYLYRSQCEDSETEPQDSHICTPCGGGCPSPKPKPTPKPTPSPSSGKGKCPKDTLKLGVCANVLNGLLDLTLGKPPVKPCCSLIQGLADVEAAVCLCTALKANVLGINLNLPISLSLLLNVCSKQVPPGFQC
ncbi:hypothetical protein F2Q68_00040681 [Brassica cretica]|uniref:Bifunctional inhibitor/plant lipid transfer protein/seed storage helical domain-containing protein n=1 Tax=Brassica cretica TaxID=69181 RepID=A0A8S9MGT8_BRACR|nr:hypothetical protein F2Q68_00040681 [Brassica cretica]